MERVLVLFVLVGLVSCTASRTGSSELGRLQGTVGLLEGNCMPGPDSEGCEPQAVEAWILLTKPSEKFDQSKLVDSVFSSRKGVFQFNVEPGTYSVFTRHSGDILCSRYSCNPACVCQPVIVVKDSTSTVKVTINKATW